MKQSSLQSYFNVSEKENPSTKRPRLTVESTETEQHRIGHDCQTSNLQNPVLQPSTGASNSNQNISLGQNTATTDIGLYTAHPNLVNAEIKLHFLNNPWVPEEEYAFPIFNRTVNRKIRKQSIARSWFFKFPWLAFSPSKKGLFCRSCVFFAPATSRGLALRNLVREPYGVTATQITKAISNLAIHEQEMYHIDATEKANSFKRLYSSKRGDVVDRMAAHSNELDVMRRQFLNSVVETIKLCGRQCLPLRGHRDDGHLISDENALPQSNDGNFRALLRFRSEGGDTAITEYQKKGPSNALYTSKTIQNEIIQLCGNFIRTSIVKGVNNAGYFSVLADETTDIAGNEQMSITVRYLFNRSINPLFPDWQVDEAFLGFVMVEDLTGEGLARTILQSLVNWGISLCGLRGQGYDGAANMAGRFRGVQSIILESHPLAFYTHCASSHSLNLVLMRSCEVREIRRALKIVSGVVTFFSSSSKRQSILQSAIRQMFSNDATITATKLTKLCNTRWVERHTAVVKFLKLYPGILQALLQVEEFLNNTVASQAETLRLQITQFPFILALNTLKLCL
ncbi:zinc finger MYM-type protein 1-like [Ciona intestinalis]